MGEGDFQLLGLLLLHLLLERVLDVDEDLRVGDEVAFDDLLDHFLLVGCERGRLRGLGGLGHQSSDDLLDLFLLIGENVVASGAWAGIKVLICSISFF